MPMTNNLVELRDVYKIYGEGLESEVRALDGVSLSIRKGEFVAVVGQSRLRQVHHDERAGLPGHPHPGDLSPGRHGTSGS